MVTPGSTGLKGGFNREDIISSFIKHSPTCGERGFTYVALLFAIVVIGITLASTGTVWSTVMKREKEEELLFRGNAFKSAIESYYKMTGIKGYPKTLEDLLDDKRQTFLTRHLRRIYADPMTGKADWVLVKAPDGGIKGVKSRSGDEPLKKKNFSAELTTLEDKSGYSEWEFVYSPEAAPEEGGPAAPGKGGPAAPEKGGPGALGKGGPRPGPSSDEETRPGVLKSGSPVPQP